MNRSEMIVPAGMRKIYRRLERWRKLQTGRGTIPDALWCSAGEAAREHGVSRTAQILGLQYDKLKRIAETKGTARASSEAPTRFVQLVACSENTNAGCVIEWESPRGKVTIRLQGGAISDLAGLSRALWDTPQ